MISGRSLGRSFEAHLIPELVSPTFINTLSYLLDTQGERGRKDQVLLVGIFGEWESNVPLGHIHMYIYGELPCSSS